MNLFYSTCLLIVVLGPLTSHQRPATDAKIKKTVEPEPEEVYIDADNLAKQDLRSPQLVEGEVGEREGEDDQDIEPLSPDTAADTMRKINPLTIAGQVSQMFRKNHQKAEFVNRSGATGADSQRNERGETSQGDQNNVVPPGHGLESEDCPSPEYVKQEPPKIVNKPHTNDIGFSVIVLAGDAAKLPLKSMKGKAYRSQGKKSEDVNEYVNIQGQGVYKTGEAEEKVTLMENNNNKKEVRVSKQLNKKPEFPVYDEDFNMAPDPFHGLLDANYWKVPDKGEHKDSLTLEDFKANDVGFNPHKVRVRSDDEADDAASKEEASCGHSWGKNATVNENGGGNEDADKSCDSYKTVNLTSSVLLKRSVKSPVKNSR